MSFSKKIFKDSSLSHGFDFISGVINNRTTRSAFLQKSERAFFVYIRPCVFKVFDREGRIKPEKPQGRIEVNHPKSVQ